MSLRPVMVCSDAPLSEQLPASKAVPPCCRQPGPSDLAARSQLRQHTAHRGPGIAASRARTSPIALFDRQEWAPALGASSPVRAPSAALPMPPTPPPLIHLSAPARSSKASCALEQAPWTQFPRFTHRRDTGPHETQRTLPSSGSHAARRHSRSSLLSAPPSDLPSLCLSSLISMRLRALMRRSEAPLSKRLTASRNVPPCCRQPGPSDLADRSQLRHHTAHMYGGSGIAASRARTSPIALFNRQEWAHALGASSPVRGPSAALPMPRPHSSTVDPIASIWNSTATLLHGKPSWTRLP